MSEDPRKGKSVVRKKRETATEPTLLTYRLDDAYDVFFAAKKAEGMRERTLDGYNADWRYFTEWLRKEYPHVDKINEVTASVIREYVNYMSTKKKYEGVENRVAETGLSPYTVALRLRTLRTIFNFLAREEMISSNPVGTIKQPRFDNETKDTFTDDEIQRLLAAPDVSTYAGLRDRTLMLVLADGGLRIQEALRLTTEHIDVKSRCIHLPASLNKSRKPRVIPLSPETVRALLTLINENKRYFDSDHVFLANYGEPLKADHFRKRLRQFARDAGIPDDKQVSPHRFRAYFCTSYLMNGGDLFSLQRIVAHSSLETTKRYVKLDDESLRKQHTQFSPLARLGISRVNKRR
ncbi:tyrosine-type recombinase/integrase [Paenibacillus sp.]|uniref:tyrosine-type recombinase/integrase n=1 Tax=Paenibacillus sp. TaxID=58172 RepID=UPI002D5B33A4|nr:tyrosine-type recombinase/integrase [Paenibacillus sp.]HZG87311.1 tyrosine-type recombinase/integrase [Paenibacillus sp.]